MPADDAVHPGCGDGVCLVHPGRRGKDEAADSTWRAVDQQKAASGDLDQCLARQGAHPGLTVLGQMAAAVVVPLLGEQVAETAFVETAAAVVAVGGEGFLAVAHDREGTSRAQQVHAVLRLSAIGHDVAAANYVVGGDAQLVSNLEEALCCLEVSVGAPKYYGLAAQA